ncbi:sugar glycosyltransferase [Enterobacteriaceae bacterium 89]|nr:sugar glycosyltransferase [Enterobacteriaceae bacterium 89]
MGSLFKQLYRYSHPRSFRHNENLWPYTRITRAESGEVCTLQYKGKDVPLVDLSALRNSQHGEVLLTATGPSTRKIDFTLLPKTVPVMGVNGAWFLSDRLNFTFYTIIDMEFFDKKPDIIRAIISQPNILFFTTMHGIAKIMDRHAADLRCRLALIEDGCYKIYQPNVPNEAKLAAYRHIEAIHFHAQHKDICFSTDIRHGIFDAGTVVYWSLQILAWLGFDTILISGLDMNNFHQPRFYETQQDKLPSYLEKKVDSLVMPSFLHASDVLKQHHIRIINLSQESSVPETIFEKVPFDAYFKNK